MDLIQTPRLILHPFTHQLMLAAIDGPESFCRRSGFAVAADWPNPDFKEALPFIAASLAGAPALEEWSRLLVVPGEQSPSGMPQIIGEAGFKALPDALGVVEIGYGVAASFRSRGYASEAVTALCDWAFHVKHVQRIRAECLPTNVGSIGVLRRAGFGEASSDALMLRWERVCPP